MKTSNNGSQGPAQIAVLSYNICFQAMTHKDRGTAAELGKSCTLIDGSKVTICASNMAKTIDGIPASVGLQSLDFVGCQEASRWDELQQEAAGTLKKMQSVGSIEGRSEMVSFYDGNKYRLDKKYFGSFDTDRPFQILVFKNLKANSGTIFINAHNPHAFNFVQMQKDLSKAVGSDLTYAEKGYRIIAVGDFNETGWDWNTHSMNQNTWAPFKDIGIDTKISVGPAVFSCCQADGKWSDGNNGIRKGSRGGDYVFDSSSKAAIQIPPAYPATELQSDHLPVMAILPI